MIRATMRLARLDSGLVKEGLLVSAFESDSSAPRAC
jgi:hypothetical protein